jgi:hypothetical protein
MNERIQQLAEQAGLNYHNWMTNESNIIDGDFKYPRLEDYKKFAELIVKECITIVDEQKECLHEEQQYWHDRDYGYALAVDDASKGIKQFFGVEE